MAVGFSFEEAKQPLEPQGFSFDEAKTPAPKVEEAPVAPTTPEEVAPVASEAALVARQAAPTSEIDFLDLVKSVPLEDPTKRFLGAAVRGIAEAPLGAETYVRALPREIVSGEWTKAFPGIKTVQAALGLIPDEKQLEAATKRKIQVDKFIDENIPRIPGLKDLAEGGQKIGKALQESISPEGLEAVRNSQIEGNLLEAVKTGDFSGLSFGKDPTLYGYALQATDVFGSLAPVIIGAAVGPTTAGVTGGSMAAGEAVGTATDYIKNKTDIELMAASPYYKDLRASGISEAQARNIITDRAAEHAAFLQGTVALFGGVATERILKGAADKFIVGKNFARLKAIAKGGALGAAEEGAQEFMEGIASDLGINREVVKEIGEDSFANLILGMVGGGPIGAVRGAVVEKPITKEELAAEDIEKEFDKAAEERARVQENIRNAFVTGFKQQTGRDATEEEIDAMVEAYEQRKLEERTAGPDALGRVEPSLQVPSEPSAEEGVAGQPPRLEAEAVDVSGVPPSGVGVGEQGKLSPLNRLFQPSDEVSPQQKRTNIHYNTLMTQPNSPVTQSLIALDSSLQKARDAYNQIADELNIPSSKEMMGLGVLLPTPLANLINYQSSTGSAVRLVSASKDLAAGNKRGSSEKVNSALKQVLEDVTAVDTIIDSAFAAAKDPAVKAKIDKLNEQKAVNAEVAARQSEIAAVPMEQRAAKIQQIESEARANIKAQQKTTQAAQDFAIDTEIKAVDSVYSDPNTSDGIPTNEQAAEVQHMDRTAKETLQALADDFLVGDEVRVGNIPGVIVGVEPSHVRFRPLRAEDPKAYIKVRKAQVKLENRPNISSTKPVSSARDLKFAERQGRLDADMDNLLANLGQSMYGSGITDVAVKELLQNSFDAIKEAIHKKVMTGVGHISITLNEVDRTITIEDDGIGMTSDIVDGAFFKIAGTAKDVPPELSSGGYGFAKVAFMTSTESISLDTVREGVRNTVSATASQVRRSDFKIKTAPAPKKEHGTKVVVKIPESYVDQKGEKQSIWFKTSPTSIQALTKPLVGPVEIKVISITSYADPETTILQTGVNFDYGAMPLLTKVNFDWGTADIYYSVDRSKDPKYPNHYVLSSGVYQFKGAGGAYGRFMLTQEDPIPFDIVVDIKSKVKPQDTQYPFTTSREAFRPSHEDDVKALVAYLRQVARGAEAQDLQDSFKNIVSMPRIDVGADIRETSEKLKKVFDKRRDEVSKFELPPMPEEVTVKGTRVFDLKGTVLVDGKPEDERKIKKSFEAEKEAPKMEQFLLQMSQDPNKPIFHNNTNVDFLEVGRAYGNPEQFFAELGSLYVEMKEAIAKSGMYGYDVLNPKNLWFTGISIDKQYGGLSLLVPYKANYLNPFYDWGARSLFGIRENFLNTMIHELAHVRSRDHGVGHNQQMLQIQQYLGDSGIMDYYRDALLDILVRHESTFTAMREAYGRSTTKNTAKSLEDYEGGTASAPTRSPISGSEYAPPTLQTGERSRGGSDIRPTGATDPASSISAGTDEALIVELGLQAGKLSRPVLEALAKDNITEALQVIAARTTGFYGDLAKVLADLKLPTTVVLNNAANLIRRQIDELVGSQQFRLFDYIQRTYPDVYKKYFQNYDRSENLEKVYEGLKFLKERNFNMGPVIAEFEDVTGAFNKNIKGLVVPGFYAPEFDAIYLNLETATNDVLLHEVLHAATEAVISADPETLTPGQRAALEQLNNMFEYAKKQIPLDLYGFIDLHEFVSELFTNKAFRERLQKVSYKPTKQSLLTSLVRTIYSLFGIDNIAGNAMAQATQLFSAVRTKKPISIGIRFAKAPRKAQTKGPVTNNWRAQEDYGTSVIQLMNKMLKSGKPWPEVAKKVGKALFRAKYSQTRRTIIPNLGLRHLADLTRFSFPQLTGAVRSIEEMLAYRFRSLTKAGDIVKDWTKLMQISAPMERLMGRVMVEATIRRIDPDTASAADLPPTDPLAKAWALLPPEFKSVYRRARDYYKDSIIETINEMKQRIIKSGKPLSEKKALLRDLQRQFGPDKLVSPYFPLRRFGQYWFQIGKGNFKEFVEFEDETVRNLAMEVRKEELIKSGRKDLADTIQSGNGISELFTKNAASTKLLGDVQELIDNISSTSTLDEAKENLKNSLDQLLYIMLPQQSMRKMFVNRQAIQGASADMLRVFAKTSFHTAYQQSRFKYADKFLANLNTAREYVDEKFKGSPNGAAYRDFIMEVERRNPQLMSNEDESVAAVLSSKIGEITFFYMLTSPATALVNILGFPQLVLSTLGGDYGYAKASGLMLNHLRQYLQSSGKRTFLPAATGKFMQTKFPSMFESGLLNPLQQRAADVFMLENDVNISLTSDVMGLSDKPSQLYTETPDKIKRFITEPLHQSERMMREIGLLTAFELAYDKLKGDPKRDLSGYILRDAGGQPITRTPDEVFEDAIQEARDKIGLTLGDFNRQMKPRTMAMPGVNILFIFKTFAIYATYAIFRNSQVSMFGPLSRSERQDVRSILEKDLKNAVNSKQIIDQRMGEIDTYLSGYRKASLRRLAGIFGVATILGGVQATPFFSAIGGMAAMFAGPGDDEDEFFDWENWFRNYCESELGGYAANLLEDMGASEATAEKYGSRIGLSVARGPVGVMTGMSLSDRVSLDLKNMWIRDPRYSREARQEVLEGVVTAIGPAAGLAMNFVDAYQFFQEGQIDRAMEKALPTFMSKPMVAYRLSNEGAKTSGGRTLIDEFSAWEIAMQAIGFQPERLASKQKSVIEAETKSRKIQDRKTAVMNRLWLEFENGGESGYQKALEMKDEFNARYPEIAISQEDIVKSFKKRRKDQAEAETVGANIPEKLRGRLMPMLEYGRE